MLTNAVRAVRAITQQTRLKTTVHLQWFHHAYSQTSAQFKVHVIFNFNFLLTSAMSATF